MSIFKKSCVIKIDLPNCDVQFTLHNLRSPHFSHSSVRSVMVTIVRSNETSCYVSCYASVMLHVLARANYIARERSVTLYGLLRRSEGLLFTI